MKSCPHRAAFLFYSIFAGATRNFQLQRFHTMTSNAFPRSNLLALIGGLISAIGNFMLFIPSLLFGGIVAGVIGFILCFLALGMAKKNQNSDMKFIIGGFILSLMAIGFGIYLQFFIAGDTAPVDKNLLFLDSL